MRLLPLVPSAHLSAWIPDADTEGTREAHRAILLRDDHTCRFCGFRVQDRQDVVPLDGNPVNRSGDNLVTCCLLCATVQQLNRSTVSREAVLIWLPQMSQAVLNAMVRGIHLTLRLDGQSPVLGRQPSKDTPMVRAAWRAYDALAKCQQAAELHIGTVFPVELAAALLEMAPASYARRGEMLGGVRVLHRGQHFRNGADIYPETLKSWAEAQLPAVAAAPDFLNSVAGDA